jgi:hypothetical protein
MPWRDDDSVTFKVDAMFECVWSAYGILDYNSGGITNVALCESGHCPVREERFIC